MRQYKIREYKQRSRQVGFGFELECGKCKARKNEKYEIIWELKPDGTLICVRDDRNEAEKDWNMRYIGA
mgnify:CR=1 FL=1